MRLTLPLFFFSILSSIFIYGEKDTREIVITGNDAMQFDLKKMEASAGENVKITIKNIGSIPKIAMGHNWVLLKKDTDALAFGQKVLASGGSATNALPKSLLGEVIAHTDVLGPGESESVTFQTPSEPGDYEYVCTFPGHFAMMRGVLLVR
ncbi:MAG: plastocyanin/azurin family copper-binding protein [Opitutales bacterium]